MSKPKKRILKLERTLAILDLETTGTATAYDRIVEIAILKVYPDGERTKFVERLNPEIPIPAEATAVHGIRDRDVKDKLPFRMVAKRITKVLHDCDLAGFNLIRFDLPLLASEFKRANQEFPMEGRRVIDACHIFHRMEPRDLSAAYQFFCGKKHTDAHASLADARASWEILQAQLERYDDLPIDLDGLHEFCNVSDDRYVDVGEKFQWRHGQAAFAFGPHQGELLVDVMAQDPGFLQWMLGKDFPSETKEIIRNAFKGKYPKRRTNS